MLIRSIAQIFFAASSVIVLHSASASQSHCGSVRAISNELDYLVNLRTVLQSGCLNEYQNVEEVLQRAFSAANVQVESGEGWRYFIFSAYPDANDKAKKIIFKFKRNSYPGGKSKLSVNASFSNMPNLTQDIFAETWKAKRLPTFRSPDLPSGLQTQDYLVEGQAPGVVTITTDENNRLVSLIFKEK